MEHQVNTGVFYDLSIANLLIPSRKNLEIGLGLVNVLTLGELKAVVAHEFGHFAQRTMAVGRWVYIAQQIAGHIVARRDALDTFLARLSSWNRCLVPVVADRSVQFQIFDGYSFW